MVRLSFLLPLIESLFRLIHTEAGIRLYANFLQHQLCVFAGDGIVVHYQYPQSSDIVLYVFACRIFPGSAQRHRDRKGRSDSLLAVDCYCAAHHFHYIFGNGHPEAAAAVTVCGGCILLGKSIKNVRNIFPVHPNARIAHRKLQRTMVFFSAQLFHREAHASRRIGKLYGIPEDVDQYLLEFHVIADIVPVQASHDPALIRQTLVHALAVDHDIDLFYKAAEQEVFLLQHHPPRFDPAHIQDIVDQVEQMLCTASYFFKLFPRFREKARFLQGDIVEADDCI